jgi:hypothetical protein
VARAVGDDKVSVHITPAKTEGDSMVAIDYGDGNLPKSQVIFNTLSKQLGSSGGSSDDSSGLASPSRPSGS